MLLFWKTQSLFDMLRKTAARSTSCWYTWISCSGSSTKVSLANTRYLKKWENIESIKHNFVFNFCEKIKKMRYFSNWYLGQRCSDAVHTQWHTNVFSFTRRLHSFNRNHNNIWISKNATMRRKIRYYNNLFIHT